MDDFKLYVNDESKVSSLVGTVYTFSAVIRMEFGLKRCAVLVFKIGKIKWNDEVTILSMEGY